MTDKFSRMTIVAALFALLGAAIAVRLGYLQILQHDYFSVLASETHMRKFEIPAQRGTVYMQDRGEKVPVAMNRNRKTLYADTRYIYHPERVRDELKRITGNDYSHELDSASEYTVLEEELDYSQAQAIEELELSGIGLSDNYVRVYPEDTLGAQMIGFVNGDGEGQYGIEEFANDRLHGRPGMLDAQTDSGGIPLATAENIQVNPRPGSDVVLTIDRNVQAFTEAALANAVDEMQAVSAHAVIMEADSGNVLAMANYPAYDPNEYSEVKDYSLFRNSAVSSQFEPGSIMKLFTMAAGLETDTVSPDDTYYDAGYTEVADATIRNAIERPGEKTMVDVIVGSINTGVIHVLRQLGNDDIDDTAKHTLYEFFSERFQLDAPTGIEQPSEPGLRMSTPEEVGRVEYANMTFGQGIATTMVRITASMTALVNGGTLYAPTMISAYEHEDGTAETAEAQVEAESIISETTSRDLREMMEETVERGGGYGTRIDGYRVGGKTGTAQIPDPDGSGYLEDRYIGTFTGFAPVDNPQYVMTVRIDEPQIEGYAGSEAAGVIFGDIMEELLHYQSVPPEA